MQPHLLTRPAATEPRDTKYCYNLCEQTADEQAIMPGGKVNGDFFRIQDHVGQTLQWQIWETEVDLNWYTLDKTNIKQLGKSG